MEANDMDAGWYPDGLTSRVIDVLLSEAEQVWSISPRPTSRLLDGSVSQRRERRAARREMSAVVRALPSRSASSTADVPAEVA